MDNFKENLKSIFDIEESDEIKFKSIEINPQKTVYFAVRESQKKMFEKLTSATLEPVAFILKSDDEYLYYSLNNEKFDENIVKEFLRKYPLK